jgi:phosphonate transport system substrate-binding protein
MAGPVSGMARPAAGRAPPMVADPASDAFSRTCLYLPARLPTSAAAPEADRPIARRVARPSWSLLAMILSLQHPVRRGLLAACALAFGFAVTTPVQAQQVLRVTTIPEEAATEQLRKFGPISKYLERTMGMKVEFTPVNDYPAAVEALVNRQVDLVWFGGFTHVQAQIRSGGKIVPIAQREEDTQFRSVFITQKDSGIKQLSDLKGKQVSFGSQSSTSGHLMPRSFLLEAGIDPDRDFKRVAYSGAHDATIASVVSGRVDAAALDITVWRKFVGEKKVDTAKVDVFYTTPPYFNYNWSVHADMPAAMREKLTQALLALSMDNPEGKEILTLNRATKYIPTKAENYKGLETAGRSAGLIK